MQLFYQTYIRARHFLQRKKYHLSLRNFFLPLSKISIDRPIFFLGVQGGGLTILSKIFQRHPETVFCFGNQRQWDSAQDEMHLTIPDLPKELSFLTNSFIHEKYPSDRARYWTYALNETLPYYRKDPEKLTEECRIQFHNCLKKIIRAYAANPKKARIIDKSQLFTINVQFLQKALNEYSPFFILVLRNPYAICQRVTTNYYMNPAKNNLPFDYLESIRLCSQHWKNSYQSAIKDGKGIKNFLVVRFEDFLQDAKTFVERICSFVDLDFSSDLLPQANQKKTIFEGVSTRWHPIRQDVTEKHLKALTGEAKEIIQSSCGDLAEKYGYLP